jgi:hypothetical protein
MTGVVNKGTGDRLIREANSAAGGATGARAIGKVGLPVANGQKTTRRLGTYPR